MGVRYKYEPSEIRDAGGYLDQQLALLEQSHAANWRRKFLHFTDEMAQRFESLKLLTELLGGNQNVDTAAWFRQACDGTPPPLPEKPYDLMALVWQQVGASVKKHGEGFFVTKSSVDLPYVLSCGFKGGSLGERFADWALAYLDPFIAHIRGWHRLIEAKMPASGQFDLWDLAVEIVNDVKPASTGDQDADEAAAAKAASNKGTTKKASAKKQPPKKKSAKKKASAKKTASGKKRSAKK